MRHGDSFRFSQVPVATIERSVFNRSHQYKTVFNAGDLVPIFVDEILPGDSFNVRASIFARMSTPVFALMDNLYLDVHFFFVPNRLVWKNWERFCGAQDSPGDSTSFTIPTVDPDLVVGGLYDFMGIPVGQGAALSVNALPFRCYNRIYNEWYRDQNLVTPVPMNTGDGPDATLDYQLRKRGKRHDYFTSCLPWPQKGPGVMLPLGSSAPVQRTGLGVSPGLYFNDGTTDKLAVPSVKTAGGSPADMAATYTGAGFTGPKPLFWSASTGLQADLSNATAATINSLRQAFQVQHMLERDARGGTRYVELLQSQFKVTSPDFRLQRPEYLGGGSIPVIVNPVVQTSNTNATSPQGNVSAYAVAARHGIGFSKAFVEHGYVLGLISARADLTYQQGLNRMYSRQTRFDFYWPPLAHLGEQAVYNKEIYSTGNLSNDNGVFGYQERWAEYKYKPSMVTGLMRSGVTGTLDSWHLAQKFANMPLLNATFITENPPMSRVLAVQNAPHFIFDSFFDVKCARPMPVYSVPGLIDHF